MSEYITDEMRDEALAYLTELDDGSLIQALTSIVEADKRLVERPMAKALLKRLRGWLLGDSPEARAFSEFSLARKAMKEATKNAINKAK